MLYLPRKNVSSEKRFSILPFATGICVIRTASKTRRLKPAATVTKKYKTLKYGCLSQFLF